ncbi:MAG: DUF5107 domain-containing protein [bacterium]
MKKQVKTINWQKLRQRSTILFFVSLLLVLQMWLSLQAQSQTAVVDIREETITIPTYDIDENPYPVFPETFWSNDLYPYTLLDSPSLVKKEKDYRLLVVENEYLKITVLPEVGGHLYNFYDKVNQREAVYVNHVMKFLTHGMRWGWPSGGFEFNFPHAHFVSTCDPIDYALRSNPDGSGSIVIGNLENRYGMRWQVTLTLHSGKSYLVQEVRLHNRSPLPHRYHFWTINAFHTDDETQVIFPARRMIDHAQQYIRTYPEWGGEDVSWAMNPFSGGSWSAMEPWDDFWCTYHHNEDAGMVHVANRHIVPGSKWFSFGSSARSNFSGAAGSDEDGPYIEVDSGSDLTQIDFRRFQPLGTRQWEEYWYPVKGLKGGIVTANRDACLSFVEDNGKLNMILNVNYPLKDGRIKVALNNKVILEASVNATPLIPYSIPLESKKGKLSATLLNSLGKAIFSYTEPEIDESKLSPEGPIIREEKDPKEMSAEELYLAGIKAITHTEENFLEAEKYFKKALEKDPVHSLAHTELGILYLGRGLWQEAGKEFKASIARNPLQGSAHYYLGWIYKMTGKPQQAIECLFRAAKYPDTYSSAYYLLGQIMLINAELDQAQQYLMRSYVTSRSTEAQILLASVYRKMSNYELAKNAAAKVLDKEPINYFAVYEQYLIAKSEGKSGEELYDNFLKLIRDEDQSFLELTCFYMNSGQYQEGIDILDKKIERIKERANLPVFCYYLGYLYNKLGDKKKGAHYFRMSQEQNKFTRVFPARLEEFFIFEETQKTLPDDFLLHYAEGNLLAGRYRFSDAIEQFHLSLKKIESLPEKERQALSELLSVINRNIGILFWKVKNKPDEAIPYYEEAIKYADWHFQPFQELTTIYQEKEEIGKAIEVARSGLEKIRDGYKLVNMLVSLYTRQGDYDSIIELISRYPANDKVRIWYQEMHQQAYVEKGKKLLREGKYTEALKDFNNATQIPEIMHFQGKVCRDFAEALWWEGLVFEQLGKESEALECWTEAISEKYDAHQRGQLYKAKSLIKLGKREQGTKLLNQILYACQTRARIITEGAAPPWEAYLYYLQGAVYEELSSKEKAIEFYNKALNIDPAHTEPVYTDAKTRLKDLEK